MFDYGRFQYFHHPLVYKIGEMGAKMIIKDKLLFKERLA